jgi:hypothetical protein
LLPLFVVQQAHFYFHPQRGGSCSGCAKCRVQKKIALFAARNVSLDLQVHDFLRHKFHFVA